MSVEATSKAMQSYLDALVARGDFADYFTDDVTSTTIGAGQKIEGREPVRDFITWLHTQAFDAHPKVKTWLPESSRQRWKPTSSAPTSASFLACRPPGGR
jgi:hypothetical protein